MSDPEVPTLADAARHAIGALCFLRFGLDPHGSDMKEHAYQEVRAVLDSVAALGQREPDTRALESRIADAMGYGDPTDEDYQAFCRAEEAAADERPATPDGGEPHITHCCGENDPHPDCPAQHAVAGGRAIAPATPEGGELDDLLAWAESRSTPDAWAVDQIKRRPHVVAGKLADLASALRSQRGVLIATRGDRAFIEGRLDAQRDENERLERELAEVRDTPRGEVLGRGMATANPSTLYMNGTSPVTVYVRATADELRALNRTEVVVVRAAEDKETPNDG